MEGERSDIQLPKASSEFITCNSGPSTSLRYSPRLVLSNLPTEVLGKVFCLLGLEELCICRRLSRRWRDLTNQHLHCLRSIDCAPVQPILTATGLRSLLVCAQNLRVLRLETCWRAVNEENLLIVAKNCPRLRVLTLSRCKGVTDGSLQAVARGCQEIEELDLSSCFQISDKGIQAVGNGCRNLKELHVGSCYGVTDDSIKVVACCCTQLHELDVSWCFKVTDESLGAFVKDDCHLRLLRIKNCPEVSQAMIAQLVNRGVSVNCFF